MSGAAARTGRCKKRKNNNIYMGGSKQLVTNISLTHKKEQNRNHLVDYRERWKRCPWEGLLKIKQ